MWRELIRKTRMVNVVISILSTTVLDHVQYELKKHLAAAFWNNLVNLVTINTTIRPMVSLF